MVQKNQNTPQQPELRKPPSAGGQRRLQPNARQSQSPEDNRQNRVTQAGQRGPRKKSWFKKSLPYLIPGIATGGSMAALIPLF